MNKIDSFSGRYEFLSNFYNCSVKFNGITYGHSEGAFQAQKTLNENQRLEISKMTAGQSKRYCGRKGPITLREDWEQVKDNIMYEIVKEKFSQNSDIRDKLLATGDIELIEGTTWHDNYWGNCTCDKCANIEGKNMLGKILMKVRSELRSED